MPSQTTSLTSKIDKNGEKMTVSGKEGVVKRSKPAKTSTSDSTTTVPTKPRRKLVARVSGGVLAHRRDSTSKTSAHRLGASSSLLGKDPAGFEECAPLLLHPRALLELSPRFPRRVPHEDANNYSASLADQINSSLSYAALCSREPGVTISRTQLVPSQSGSPGFRLGQMSLGNSHSPIDHVQGTQRAPRSSMSANLDTEGWSSPESTPSKHHKTSMPIRMHLQRPLDFEHMLPNWSAGHDWDQRPDIRTDIRTDLQDDIMVANARANLGASLGVNLSGVGSGVVTVGNTSNNMPSACRHHFPRTTICDPETQFFYPESSALNIDWDTKTQLPRTPSFNTFSRNYSSLQVQPQRSYHQSSSPQPQESYLGTSPNTITSSSRSGCNQQPSSNFTSSYSCTSPTCCAQAPTICCNQGSPMTPTGGMPNTASVVNQQQPPPNRGHMHCSACNCTTMHQNRTPTNEPHYHQYNPQNTSGPVSTGSNTTANNVYNNAALRRSVRPPRTMLINAAAAGTHLTNSRARSASRQTPTVGRRPVRVDHSPSYGRQHHCRRVSMADYPHRFSYRAHTCCHSHYNPPSR